jgi:hypothetical protein
MLHLVPSAEDCAKHDKNPTTDVFGRSRHAEEKGNRGGVGSFFSMSRTLYVSYGAASESLGARLQEVVARVFGEWGPLDDVYVVRSKSIAFVRYVFRASAEFAKEAMGNQSLQPAWWKEARGGVAAPEVLNIRWAFDDPNPTAIRRVKREHEEAFVDGAEREERRLAPEQRAALQMQRALEAGVAGAPAGAAALPYPATDAQYGAAQQDAAYAAWAAAAAAAGYSPEAVAAYYAAQRTAAAGGAAAQQQQAQQQQGHAAVVLAADCYEYDADDPYYQQGDEEEDGAAAAAAADPAGAQAPPPSVDEGAAAPAAAPTHPRLDGGAAAGGADAAAAPRSSDAPPGASLGTAAPLALLAGYGSDGSEDSA